MADVKKLVDQVRGRQTTRVVDRRLAQLVIRHDADEAVSNRAALVADREGRDPLDPDAVRLEPEPGLPAGEPVVHVSFT